MSSTLCMRVAPKPTRRAQWQFKLPIKAAFARRYYDHDGSLGGGMITLTIADLAWIEGLIAGSKLADRETADLESIAEHLRDGDVIDMWFEV